MVFAQMGNKKIVVDAADPDHLNLDEIRADLALSHPEVKNAEVRVKTEDGHTIVEFAAKAGRKG
jgi:hypothetical protein